MTIHPYFSPVADAQETGTEASEVSDESKYQIKIEKCP